MLNFNLNNHLRLNFHLKIHLTFHLKFHLKFRLEDKLHECSVVYAPEISPKTSPHICSEFSPEHSPEFSLEISPENVAIKAKMSRYVGITYKLRQIIPLTARLFNSLVQSHLNYCSLVWGSSCKSNIESLFSTKKKAIIQSCLVM